MSSTNSYIKLSANCNFSNTSSLVVLYFLYFLHFLIFRVARWKTLFFVEILIGNFIRNLSESLLILSVTSMWTYHLWCSCFEFILWRFFYLFFLFQLLLASLCFPFVGVVFLFNHGFLITPD